MPIVTLYCGYVENPFHIQGYLIIEFIIYNIRISHILDFILCEFLSYFLMQN